MNVTFSEYLRNLRGIKTQKIFSKELGISNSLYTKLENGEREPSKKILILLKKIDPNFKTDIFLN